MRLVVLYVSSAFVCALCLVAKLAQSQFAPSSSNRGYGDPAPFSGSFPSGFFPPLPYSYDRIAVKQLEAVLRDDLGQANECVTQAVIDADTFSGSITFHDNFLLLNFQKLHEDSANKALPLPQCVANNEGLFYSLHDDWNVLKQVKESGRNTARGEECSKTLVGPVTDPGLACGDAYPNPLCKQFTIPASSAVRESAESAGAKLYQCTPEIHAKNPFACQVGDLSGKFGAVKPLPDVPDRTPQIPTDRLFIAAVRDQHGLPSCSLIGKSVLFRCANGTPIWCGKLEKA